MSVVKVLPNLRRKPACPREPETLKFDEASDAVLRSDHVYKSQEISGSPVS